MLTCTISRLALAVAALTCGAAELPRAKWLANGIIDAGGSHEPLIFLRRVGGNSPDVRQAYERAQSEEVIRALKEQGVEIFHTHLYKGFGMEAEKAEMEDARRAAVIAHRYGMKVDSYIQWNTLAYETFLAEEPRAKDWVQRDAFGQPILLTYGFEHAWRYRPCFSNPEFLAWLKRVVRYAVEEVKTDFIHFDNFDLNPEPDSCHCDFCTRGFRKFLKEKYPEGSRRERFGFENLDYVNPPIWNRGNPPEKMQAIRDPVIQEWVSYRCHEMSEALREVGGYAHSLNPEVAIEVNPHGITGGNRAWEAGLDHAQFLHWTDAFWTEEPNDPGLTEDGRLITRIRSYKLARAFRNILLAYVAGDKVALAECLAFNQTIGYAGEFPLAPETLSYLSFYRQHRDLYVDTQDDATVAVLRSYASITNHNARAQLGAILAEQALIEGHVPFRLIFDEDLKDLSRYRALILPDSECLSDQQVAAIRAFVAQGGGLVATGSSGQYDEWLRPRRAPALADLLPGQKSGHVYGEEAHWVALSGPTTQKEYERGRSAYIPGLQFDGPMPEPRPYFEIDNRFWKNPKNARQLLDALRWVARDALPVEVTAPRSVVVNLVSQAEKRRSMLHMVNYAARQAKPLAGIVVKLRLPDGAKSARASVVSTDAAGTMPLRVETDAAGVRFTVPRLGTYSVVEVDWQ